MAEQTGAVKKKSWLKRLAVAGGAGAVVLLVGGYVLVPVVASAVAPGMIADAAGKALSGGVKVGRAKVGWSGPIELQGVELRDPTDAVVGTFDVSTEFGIWRAIRGLDDLGTVTLKGRVDVVRPASGGATNLEQAVAPRPAAAGAPAPAAQGQGALPTLAGVLRLDGVDATYADVAGGQRAAMRGLKGDVKFATAGSGSADVSLDAAFGSTLDGPASGALKVRASAAGFVQAGRFNAGAAKGEAQVEARGTPVDLIDALAAQGGVLSGALGATADLTLSARGAADAVEVDLVLTAPNARADLAFKTEPGSTGPRVRASRKGSVSVKSLAFAQRVPGVSKALADAQITVSPGGWPGATITIASLDVPAGRAGNWAGAKVELSAFTDGPITGTLTRTGGAPEPLVVRPITLGIIAPDLVKGVELIGNTGATVGGQSAGDLDLIVQASDLLGQDGTLMLAQGGVPGKLIGKVEARSFATGLLAPLLAGIDLPLRLEQDVGPTLDLTLTATTRGGEPGSIPPTDVSLSVRSQNINAAASLTYDATGLGLSGSPAVVKVRRAAPLLQRLLATGGGPEVSGDGSLELELTAGRLPVSGRTVDPSLASGTGSLRVADLALAMPGRADGPPLNIAVVQATLGVSVVPRTSIRLTLTGQMKIDGDPVTVGGQVRLSGLSDDQDLPRIGVLGTRRLSGGLEIKGLSPRSISALALGPGASGAAADVLKQVTAGGVGVALALGDKTSTSQQPLSVTVRSAAPAGVSLVGSAELRSDSAELLSLSGSATLTDALARAALRAAGHGDQAVEAARLRRQVPATVTLQPVSVPLRPGTLEPDWPRARSIVAITADIPEPVQVDGLTLQGRPTGLGLASTSLTASVPLAVLDPSPDRIKDASGLRVTGSLDLIGQEPTDLLARLRVSGGSQTDGSRPRISIDLSEVATARLDAIVNQGGLLPGLLGEKASAVASIAVPQGGSTELSLDVTSPLLSVKGAQFIVDGQSWRSGGPMTVAMTAQPSFINPRLAGPSGPAALALTEPATVTFKVEKLALSSPGAASAGGLFKPGVFAVDAVAIIPRLAIKEVRATGPQPGAPSAELSDVTVRLQSTGTASAAGIAFNASVGGVTAGGQAATDPSVIRGSIDGLADVGGNLSLSTAVVNLKATTGRFPTPMIDLLAATGGKVGELLGDSISANVDVRGVSQTGAGGFVSATLTSPRATLVAAGPVAQGVLDTGAPGATPLRVELNQFRWSAGGDLLKIFPIFAELERAGATESKPVTIVSRGLRLPIDGDPAKLSGLIDVDLGRIDYKFSQALGGLLEDTVFRGGRGQDQRPVPPFTITIDRGVVAYGSVQQKVALPVRNLDFQTRGVIDLVNRRLDVVTYIPTVAAAPGLAANLNRHVGGVLGRLVPGVVEKITSIPVRTAGPLDQPSTAFAGEVVVDEFKDALNPGNIIRGIGDILGGRKDEPKPSPPAQPAAPAGPSPAPGPGPSPSPRRG